MDTNKKTLFGKILLILGIIISMSSMVMLIYFFLSNYGEMKYNQQIVGKFQEIIISEPDSEDSKISIDGSEYIGIIEIQSIGLILPVLSSCDNNNLDRGICLYSDGDNRVIGGHNRASQFNSLYRMKIGDQLFYYDSHTNKYIYELVKTEKLSANEVEKLKMNNYGITLFTCFWGNRDRYVLRFKQKL